MKKNTLMKSVILCTVFVTLFFSGCSLLPKPNYLSPKSYDIGIPTMDKTYPFDVEVRPFTSDAAGRYKMLYRLKNNQLDIDEYNRWTQPPGSLLTKYLKMAFVSRNIEHASVKFIVTGTVLVFEADLDKGIACLSVKYEISVDGGTQDNYSASSFFTEPMTDDSAQAYAAAMSVCVSRFSEKLSDDLYKLYALQKDHNKKI